jgi:hypothetical protein
LVRVLWRVIACCYWFVQDKWGSVKKFA